MFEMLGFWSFLISPLLYLFWPRVYDFPGLRLTLGTTSAAMWADAHAPWIIPIVVTVAVVIVLFGRDIEYINRRRKEDRDMRRVRGLKVRSRDYVRV